MKALAFALVPLLINTLLSSQAPPRPAKNPVASLASELPAGRYQMTAATLDGNERTVFLLDTTTGRVWKFQTGYESKDAEGKLIINPPRFVLITVDELNVAAPQK
jgi:hypothetical protein